MKVLLVVPLAISLGIPLKLPGPENGAIRTNPAPGESME
jgi:hypothetical protein